MVLLMSAIGDIGEVMNRENSDTPVRPADRFLVFGAPDIGKAEVDEVTACLRNGWLGIGPKVTQFEEDFRNYIGASFAVAASSCTAALHLSMLADGLRTGDEVITTPLTFCATVNAIIHAGPTPVLVDVDPHSLNLNPAKIEDKITEKTRAILPVHFAGRPCDMDAICAIAKRHKLRIIEDCAHAVETTYRGGKAGTFGDFGCFSFYATKNITTGEGGMVLAKREEDAARIRTLALHGMSADVWRRFCDEGYRHYSVVECGYKYNMTDLQAAIGIHQLKGVENRWERRRTIWQRYNEAFADLPVDTPADPEPGTRHAYHLYTILIDESRAGISRDSFLAEMSRHNIGVGVHYMSVPEHPYYRTTLGWEPGDYPNAMRIGRETVSLPLSAKLTEEDVADVIAAVRTILCAM